MDAKLLIVLVIAINCYSSCGAALRRTPKVYNALITTDENLTSSRAFPVIQPTIHESGIAHYPYSPYNPYGGYYGSQLLRFGQPITPGLVPRDEQANPSSQNPFLPQAYQPQHHDPHAQPYPGYPYSHNPPTAPEEEEPHMQPYPGYPYAHNPPTAPGKQQPQPYPGYPYPHTPPSAPEEQPPQRQPYPGYPYPQSPPSAPGEQQPETPPQAPPQAQPHAQPQMPPHMQPSAENPTPGSSSPQQHVELPTVQPQSSAPNYMPVDNNHPQQMPQEKLPIPLNAYGLPPALIPFHQYPNHRRNPVNLSPYGYNQYPLIYDPLTGYREQYLPPYNYFQNPAYARTPAQPNAPPPPPHAAPTASPATHATPHAAPTTPSYNTEETPIDEASHTATAATTVNYERIKNVSKSKNHAVPDVQAPPIPSGAKAKHHS